jgi:exonuclease SbcC
MVLHRLRLENYKQYRHLDLVFREGLVGIIGRNGAGKSTLFDAILYCLYGREETNKTLVRSSFASDNAPVVLELEFYVGESLYRVRREFKGRSLSPHAHLYKNDRSLAHTPRAVNEEITKVLGLSREAFKRSVFSGQKELDELTQTSREERRKTVRRMLGLERLDKMQTDINADIRDRKNRILGQEQALLTEEQRSRIEATIVEIEGKIADTCRRLEQEQLRLGETENRYRQAQARFEEAEKRLNRFNELARALEQTGERIRQLSAQKGNLEAKIAQMDLQRQQLDAQREWIEGCERRKKQLEALDEGRQKFLNYKTHTERLSDLRRRLEEARRRQSELEKELARLPEVAASLRQKADRLAKARSVVETTLEQHGQLKGQLAMLQERIEERKRRLEQLRGLGTGGTCPTCLQPLREGYEHALQALEREIAEWTNQQQQYLQDQLAAIIARAEALRAQETRLAEEVETLREEDMRLRESDRQKQAIKEEIRKLAEHIAAEEAILLAIGQVDFDEAQYQALKEQVKAEEEAYREYKDTENYLRQEQPRTLGDYQQVCRELQKAQKEHHHFLERQEAVGHRAEEYEKAKADFTTLADAQRKQSDCVQQIERELLQQRNDLQREQRRLLDDRRLSEQIQEQQAQVVQLEQLHTLVGQFKTHLLSRIGPSISRHASELFQRITRGRYEAIRVDDSFDFFISDAGVYYPIERFSGGEIDLANLCLRIAITRAIFELSGASHLIGFLGFDEILGSQDEERRIEIMQAFLFLKEQFRQIYVVSHIETLKDFFPHLLEVSADANGSTVTWK